MDIFRKMKAADLTDSAMLLLNYVEVGMKLVEKLDKCTDIPTRMIKSGISNATKIMHDVLIAYEERAEEGVKKD